MSKCQNLDFLFRLVLHKPNLLFVHTALYDRSKFITHMYLYCRYLFADIYLGEFIKKRLGFGGETT